MPYQPPSLAPNYAQPFQQQPPPQHQQQQQYDNHSVSSELVESTPSAPGLHCTHDELDFREMFQPDSGMRGSLPLGIQLFLVCAYPAWLVSCIQLHE